MSTVLITGANRGIGLELCRQYSARGEHVIGACRARSTELDGTSADIHDDIDVTDSRSIGRLAEALSGQTVDVLINCAGILSAESLDDLDWERIRRQIEVNTLGPLRVTQALLPRLRSGSKVIIITSRMGSVEDNTSGGMYGYRISKAGANMVGRSLAHDLGPKRIGVFLLHPGMVATEMTGRRGIPPNESAQNLIVQIDSLDFSRSGTFWHADGSPLPW